MTTWIRRLRGALGMGLLWALAWGLVGGLIELTWNLWPGFPLGPLMDMWIQGLVIPGFIGGGLFALILGVAEHHRRYEELSPSRFALWGAAAGMLLGGLVVLIAQPSHWLHGAIMAGALTVTGSGRQQRGAQSSVWLLPACRAVPAAMVSGDTKNAPDRPASPHRINHLAAIAATAFVA